LRRNKGRKDIFSAVAQKFLGHIKGIKVQAISSRQL